MTMCTSAAAISALSRTVERCSVLARVAAGQDFADKNGKIVDAGGVVRISTYFIDNVSSSHEHISYIVHVHLHVVAFFT